MPFLKKPIPVTFASAALVACSAAGDASDASEPVAQAVQSIDPKEPDLAKTIDPSALDFVAIDGKPLPFANFDGKVVLVVNTASRCGYTGQYKGLQALWTEYRDRGLVVLGVPSNDFGGQEPGTEAQVKEFCEINYGVDFPLTQKYAVKGPDAHPFYAHASDVIGPDARPKWNFHKVLVDRAGKPVNAFASSVTPDSGELRSAIEALL